jgi:predicted DNA-binding protein with PD1-like motif
MDHQKRHSIHAALDDSREIHVGGHVYKRQCKSVLIENIFRQLKLILCTNNAVVDFVYRVYYVFFVSFPNKYKYSE